MIKTTVYLSESEAADLRRTSALRGQSQSELIREGVREVTRTAGGHRFRSKGVGQGSGEPTPITWDTEALADEVAGRR
ncbi:hypothetical protein BH20ACT7_BH20ACT7_13500 [soil metagenome]|jgi:Arc/MetJ-type ribon-helix-helix transcriptional regulator